MGWPELVCSACHGELDPSSGGLSCATCHRRFPIVAGIPDLRLVPDRYLTFEEDRAKAVAVDRAGGGFAGALAAYWSMTPEVPPAVARRFAANMAQGVERGAWPLDLAGDVGPGDVLLDVGCGTGGTVAAAAARGATVVGIDSALRWLIVARRFLEERGVDALLVAADGATAPFRFGSFSVVTCVEVLEHAADQRGLVNGCLLHAERPDSRAVLITANRFSVAPEPGVRVWGVGFLPRRFAAPYVELRRRTSYRNTRPVSIAELRAFVGPHDDVVIGQVPLPPIPASASPPRRLATRLLDRLTKGRGGSAVAPFLGVRADRAIARRPERV